jgi:nucleoid-associated protein YgaU
MPATDPLSFDAPLRNSSLQQHIPLGGLPRAIREASREAGIDPIGGLFDEAVGYAKDHHYRLAKERLHMLLCMAPDDGEARLQLAKINVATQKWREALTALDQAESYGQKVERELRRAIENNLRSENAAAEEQRSGVAAARRGEVSLYQQETRELRSENAMLRSRVTTTEREIHKWAWATSIVSLVAVLFILGNLFFGGAGETSTETLVSEDPGAPLTEEAILEGAPQTATAVAQQIADRLRGETDQLADARLEVLVDQGSVALSGSVLAFQQLEVAERIASSLAPSGAVDMSHVTVRARLEGTTHIVASGDMLGSIAQQYYGDHRLSDQIAKANRSTLGKRPRMLRVGEALIIPPLTE